MREKRLDWIWELKDMLFVFTERNECVITEGNAREEVKWREAMCRETCLWAEGCSGHAIEVMAYKARAYTVGVQDGGLGPPPSDVSQGHSSDCREQTAEEEQTLKKVWSSCWGRQKRDSSIQEGTGLAWNSCGPGLFCQLIMSLVSGLIFFSVLFSSVKTTQ